MLVGDRGAVTVEAALALCSLVVVTALAVTAIGAGVAHLRCLDAAREAARLVARGEPDRAREAVARIAPGGAALEVRMAGDEADVRVAVAVAGLAGLTLDVGAHAVLEPGAVLAATLGSEAGGSEASGGRAAGEPVERSPDAEAPEPPRATTTPTPDRPP